MSKILIIANFCRKFDGTINGRFLYLAELLSQKGFNVELITSDFNHGTKKYKEEPVRTYKSTITYIHEPGYSKNLSIRRLYSHWVWGNNIGKYLYRQSDFPNYIYCAVPSLTAALKCAMFSKRNNIKFIIDIQDLWPEAFGLAIKSKVLQKVLFFPFKVYADYIYKRASAIVAVSETYKNRALLVNRLGAKGICAYLGNDKVYFDKAKTKFQLERFTHEIRLCYIGTLGYSYDIKCVIDALKQLNDKKLTLPVIKFIVIGDGPLQNDFKKYAKEKDILSEFTGRLQYDKMVGILCSCDIAINPIKEGAAASIINKVGDYALAGLPVINTQECEEYRKLLDEYECGINCKVGDVNSIALAIEKLALNKNLRECMGKSSRRLAEERFDRNKTYLNILELFKDNMQ